MGGALGICDLLAPRAVRSGTRLSLDDSKVASSIKNAAILGAPAKAQTPAVAGNQSRIRKKQLGRQQRREHQPNKGTSKVKFSFAVERPGKAEKPSTPGTPATEGQPLDQTTNNSGSRDVSNTRDVSNSKDGSKNWNAKTGTPLLESL